MPWELEEGGQAVSGGKERVGEGRVMDGLCELVWMDE